MNRSLLLFLACLSVATQAALAQRAQMESSRPATNAQRDKISLKSTFPRLLGMNIGAKNYDDAEYQRQLAKLDVAVLGFYKGWKPRYGIDKVVGNLKELSGGKLSIGQYTVLNECGDDPKNTATLDVVSKLNEMNWWARKASGSRVQWTSQYNAWDINFTEWSRADASGLRYGQWLAERNDRILFKPVPFDFWFCDNIFGKPRVTADWNGDGVDDSPKDPAIAAAYRAGHRAEWDHIRKIHPGIMLMGNVDTGLAEPEYVGQLEGAFLEALMGKRWSIEAQHGWTAVMTRYRDALKNTRSPHVVGFNVHGRTNDFRFLRYAFASCLMDDGYFCYSDSNKGYSSVSWFDEFDFNLGAAVSKPSTAEWKNGVWRRDFEHGIALVNPTEKPATVELEPGFGRLQGTQAIEVNSGKAAAIVTLEAKDGILLRRTRETR